MALAGHAYRPTRYGVTRQSVHIWLRHHANWRPGRFGRQVLETGSLSPSDDSGDQGRIVELRRSHPRWGPRRILTQLLSGYVLTFGGFLMLGGRSTDLLGRLRLLVGGTLQFALSSVACAAMIALRATNTKGEPMAGPETEQIVTDRQPLDVPRTPDETKETRKKLKPHSNRDSRSRSTTSTTTTSRSRRFWATSPAGSTH
jgi:hypothetical protein